MPSFSGADAAKLLAVNAAGTDTEWVGLPFANVQIFTSGGTFTPVAGRSKYFVIAVGAGGGGFDSNVNNSGQGGMAVLGMMTISSAQTVVIGAGGSAGASPTDGTDTSIGSLLIALGGKGASHAPAYGGTVPAGCVSTPGGRSASSAMTGASFLSPPLNTSSSVTLPQDGHGGASSASALAQRAGGAGIVIFMW